MVFLPKHVEHFDSLKSGGIIHLVSESAALEKPFAHICIRLIPCGTVSDLVPQLCRTLRIFFLMLLVIAIRLE